ncbi:hypothetical protein [Lysobacter sp. HA35]
MDDFERRKKELLTPIFFEAGAGLHDCQSFEYGVAYLLYLLSRLGASDLSVDRTSAILDDEEKKTAGQLVALLKKHMAVNEDLAEILHAALSARNYLVHRYLVENIERILEPEGLEKMPREIRALRGQVRRAQAEFDPLIRSLALLADGFSIDEWAEQAKARIMGPGATLGEP